MKTAHVKIDTYQLVTDRIIAALESGTAPWRKPWRGGGEPRNAITGRQYSGMNWFLLSCHGGEKFLTFKQAQERGGCVRKGERGCPVIYWNWVEKDDANGNKKKIPFLKHFTVFSIDQCDGVELPADAPDGEATPFVARPDAEQTIANTGAEIRHGGGRAFYRPASDSITLPEKTAFHASDEYYSTAFHELVHWTGHQSRLKRDGVCNVATFGSNSYSKEELIAEMGAAFLSASHGIDSCMDNSASYLAGWISALKGDSKLAIGAASAARKAADFILGKTECAQSA